MNPPSRAAVPLLALSLSAVSCGLEEPASWDVDVAVSELPPGPLAPRQDHSLVWSGEELLVWGGHGTTQHDSFAGGAAYSPDTGSWRRLPEVDLESRTRHNAVMVKDRMLVWGGFTPTHSGGPEAHLAGDGALYDIEAGSWEPIAPAPEARSLARAVTVGEHVVFGGGHREQGGRGFLVCSLVEDTWDTVALDGVDDDFALYDMQVLGDEVVAVGGGVQGMSVATFGVDDADASVRRLTGLEEAKERTGLHAGLAASPVGETFLAVRVGENARLYEVDGRGQADLVDETRYTGFRLPFSLTTRGLDAGEMDYVDGLGLLATGLGEFSMWDPGAGTTYRLQTEGLSDYCGPFVPAADGVLLGWGGLCETSGVRADVTA
ncbi:Kelch repeat-containing protein [Nocardiopsis quinghaiensis]|uniref:Kelch repeat-containing protein n=1 Tax=Nocardiopsis quinghaiensis TaxID=464995 RepID=UPI00123B1D81|nr:hypothetical protein [Nocardiopsis quinghaiensis]